MPDLMFDWSRLIVVVGPSGVGKDSLLNLWRQSLAADAGVHFARRVITRPADAGGEAHEALTHAQFTVLQAADSFAFDWQAHGLSYGVRRTSLASLADPVRPGWVVVNGSRSHLPQLKALAPDCRVVEITAPAALLRQRLAGRQREDAVVIAARLQRVVAPFEPDLRISNEGPLAEGAGRLHDWWRSLAATAPA